MRYADIKPNDINNGEGLVVSLWVTGCPIKCVGCHNENIWDFNEGTLFDEEAYQRIVTYLSDNRVAKGFSVLGGEPLAPGNYDTVLNLIKRIRIQFPDRPIWVWSGYEYSNIEHLEILDYIDVIITGRYVETLKDESTWWRGSLNQEMTRIK